MNIELKPTAHWSSSFVHHRNKVPKAYQVFVDGVMVGVVEQGERHSYKKAGRLRYGDTYSIKWRAKLNGNLDYCRERLYAESRKQAVGWLLEAMKK
jgi:hypothetical protein